MKYAGQDVGAVMADETEHVHSRSAYDMMDEYKVGELGGDEKIVSEGMSADPRGRTFFFFVVAETRLDPTRGFPPGRDGHSG
jgi:hypothetical protein